MTAVLRRPPHEFLAFGTFLGSCTAVHLRYYQSAAFERPLYLTFSTLLLTSALCLLHRFYMRRATARGQPYHELGPTSPTSQSLPLSSSRPRSSSSSSSSDGASERSPEPHPHGRASSRPSRLRRLLASPAPALALCVFLRVLIAWRVVRTEQCARLGMWALLPCLTLLLESLGPRVVVVRLPRGRFDQPDRRAAWRDRWRPLLRSLVVALAYGASVAQLYPVLFAPSSVVCPARWARLIPFAQFVALCLDAAILLVSARVVVRHGSSDGDRDGVGAAESTFAQALLASTVLLAVACAFPFYATLDFDWLLDLDGGAVVRDLVVDSALLAALLLSGARLLAVLSVRTVAVALTGVGLHVDLWSSLFGAAVRLLQTPHGLVLGFVAMVCVVLLLLFDRDVGQARDHSSTVLLQKVLVFGFAGSSALLLVAGLVVVPRSAGVSSAAHHPVESLVRSADDAFARWEAQASGSQTVEAAVEAYERRYGIPPPPHFDKWFAFARSVNATIVDHFDQIAADLEPFWGVAPADLRARTAHLLEHPWLNMGGLRIRGGELERSPHVPGSHAWMMDASAAMIRPFARWLPDMDLAFNLNDECRVAVPFEDMRPLLAASASARARLGQLAPADRAADWTPPDALAPPWADGYMHAETLTRDVTGPSPFFSEASARRIFRSHVAPSCPPASPARRTRWWSRRVACADCARPHTTGGGGYVANWTLAGDLCHQPDAAHLDGFLLAPAPMVATRALLPVFSQGRVGGFADILVPSPWNFVQKTAYDAAADVAWAGKRNALFWRGAASDGVATHGRWEGFLRARLVGSALRFVRRRPAASLTVRPDDDDDDDDARLRVNVTFVGNFGKCDREDCRAEAATFYGDGAPPPAVPFAEHWRYKHLVDADGAGFSGRFIPFLQSRSLVYRAGLFRTWFDERVHAWQHFVPVDLRLGGSLWKPLRFFGGGGGRRGDELGEAIAAQGQEWAGKVLRPEDMQVYMFRLLLEWGRLVDDQRERLGFAAS